MPSYDPEAPKLILDLETRSCVDLKQDGLMRYANDSSTMILSAHFILPKTTTVQTYTYEDVDKIETLKSALQKAPSGRIAAWNAAFELYVLNACWDLDLVPDQMYCLAYQSRCACGPSALKDAAKYFNLPIEKDTNGTKLIKKFGQAKSPDDPIPEGIEDLFAYGEQDVKVSSLLNQRLPQISVQAQQEWVVNEYINEDGIKVDLDWAYATQDIESNIKSNVKAKALELTNGSTSSIQSKAFKEWFIAQLSDAALKHVPLTKTGARSLSKNVCIKLLSLKDHLNLSEQALTGLKLFDDGRLTAAKKYATLIHKSDEDGRLRNSFVMAGAAQTGRCSSWGVQLHNLRRAKLNNPEAEIILAETNGCDAETLTKLLRSTFMASDGWTLVGCDWSAIEMRMMRYLVGDVLALDLIREHDHGHSELDVYQIAARDILGDVNLRQGGKTLELSCQYQIGADRLQDYASNTYGVNWTKEEAQRNLKKWRDANPRIVQFWRELERAARSAVELKDQNVTTFVGNNINFTVVNINGNDTLRVQLPCSRYLYYGHIEVKEGNKLHYRTSKKHSPNFGWTTNTLYGGRIANAITQGACASLLRQKLVQCHQAKLRTVIHVHDSITCETPQALAQTTADTLREIMLDVPSWAQGLPLEGETWINTRFQG